MKYFFSILFLISTFFLINLHDTYAATISFDRVPAQIDRSQEFSVDVLLDAQNETFNAVEGSITFPERELSLVRIETANSIVPFWIEQPRVKDGVVTFSGMIPGGFNGFYKPLEGTQKFPGTLVRLVFKGEKSGEAVIATEHIRVALSDGQGTLRTVPDMSATVSVLDSVTTERYSINDTVDPLLTAEVFSDPQVFDGKQTLLFVATDKESGIDRVQVKEGWGRWKDATSPYLLEDQKRKSIISVRAIDSAGNKKIVTIDALEQKGDVSLWIIIGGILIALYVISKFKQKKK